MYQEGDSVGTIRWWVVGLFGTALLFGPAHVVGGMLLGFLTLAVFAFIFAMLPNPIRITVAHLHILIDIALTIYAYKMFGSSTSTALMAAGTTGACVSLFLLRQRRLLLGTQDWENLMNRI